MGNSNFIRGTFILTMATMISKILGFIYVIPFTLLVGTQGYILFEYAYKPYVLILSLSTMGVPLAVSKFISRYNELGDYETGQRLFRSGMVIMTGTGIIGFAVLQLFASQIAGFLVQGGDGTGNTVQDISYVIRMVSFAMLIVPSMSLIRGYFQGFETMGPTAVSQVVEQIVRIMVILAGSFLMLKIMDKSVKDAVGVATFAAFAGAAAGWVVLLSYWKKRKKPPLLQKKKSLKNPPTLKEMYKELLSYAVPFVIIGLAIPVYQTLDTFMINGALISTGKTLLEAETVNSVLALVQKVILIPVSLATAFGLSLVPTITKSYTGKKWAELQKQINKTLQIILFLTVPASIGLVALGEEAFVALFGEGQRELGGTIMAWHAPTAILYALFIVTAAVMQGIQKHKEAVYFLLTGILIKLLVNEWLILKWEGIGAILATNAGFLVSIFLNFVVIHKVIPFERKNLLRQMLWILFFNAIMWLSIALWSALLSRWLPEEGYVQDVGVLMGGIGLGGAMYILASLQTALFRDVFGNRLLFLNKLTFKK